MRLVTFLLICPLLQAEAKRLVILKLDGVPAGLVESLRAEVNPVTGKSKLPWIQRVFAERGVRLSNFYSRGLSLSASGWQMLDTGQHLVIKGNAEYDRYALRVYDYINFLPFYLNYARSRSVDMPSLEVLDALGIPLLFDRFPRDQRFQGFQLNQRGVRWNELERSVRKRFTSRSVRTLFNEWQTGFEMTPAFFEQTERALLEHLADDRVVYLDMFSGEFDHLAHLTNDRATQAAALERADALIGRLWLAIEKSPLAPETLFVVVSDHGMNSVEGIHSQSINLVDFFRSAAGGGHHVLINRHPLQQFKLKGLDPFVSEVTTSSAESGYLQGQSQDYPTVLLDLDGNERASVYLRNSQLNVIQILLTELTRPALSPELRAAGVRALVRTIESQRAEWSRVLAELGEELIALRAEIEREKILLAKLPGDRDENQRRRAVRWTHWREDEAAYSAYLKAITALLSITDDFDAARAKTGALVPKRAMGELNSIGELQSFVTGPAAAGLKLGADGELDFDASFRRIHYPLVLTSLAVRNSVQTEVGPAPVDFVAARAPNGAVWLYAGEEHQVLLFISADGKARYQPVRALRQSPDGELSFEPAEWRTGLPLRLWEDTALDVPGDRTTWFADWHTEQEWLRATHRTRYSNAIASLKELFAQPSISGRDPLSRFEVRRRRLTEPDMIVFASDHWNFNVRNPNPGGNHGAFFRLSTNAIFMLSGGEKTGIPQGLTIEEPYDALSFVPTLLMLMGKDTSTYPGPVIERLRISAP